MSNLVLWRPPNEALLQAYAASLRRRAFAVRERYQRLLDQVNDQVYAIYALDPELENKIVQVMERIRARTEGAPMTEFSDTVGAGERDSVNTMGMTYQQREAHRFLCKKAWRRIAQLVHPDRSSEDIAVFQKLKEAYEQSDLVSLQEFVLASDRTVVEQIQWWLTEIEKPPIRWQILQQMPMFQIARALSTGNHERARKLAAEQRLMRLRELELEELAMGS